MPSGLITSAPLPGRIIQQGYSPFPGDDLGTAVLVDPARMVRTFEQPATNKDRQLMVVVSPTGDAGISYRTGFACTANGEITTPEQWLEHLRKTP